MQLGKCFSRPKLSNFSLRVGKTKTSEPDMAEISNDVPKVVWMCLSEVGEMEEGCCKVERVSGQALLLGARKEQ